LLRALGLKGCAQHSRNERRTDTKAKHPSACFG